MKESFYRRLFESAQNGILILDGENGNVVDVNPFLINLLGYSREAFLNKKIWELDFLKHAIENEEKFQEWQAKDDSRYENLSTETCGGRRVDLELVSNVYLVKQHRMLQCNIRDITEHNKAEKSLLESESLFRGIFKEHCAVMLCIDNNTGQIVEANQAAAVFYGYPLEKLMQMKIQQFNTLSPAKIAKKMDDAFKRQGNVFEFQHLLADGSIRDVEVHSTPITIGKQSLLFSIIHDITERKRVEKALQQSEERFRSFIENANDIVYALSPTGLITYISPNSLEFDGIPADEMLGEPIDSFLHPDDISLWHRFLEKILKSGKKQADLEYRVRHPDGSWRWHISNGSPLHDENGVVSGYVGIARDITEQKHVEEKMRFLGAVTENMHESIVVTDIKGHITYINKSGEKLFGYTFEELAGNSMDQFNIDAKADEIQSKLYESVARGATYNGEALNHRKDGSEFICGFSVSPLIDNKGNITSYIGLSRDITANRNLEKAAIRQERLSAIGELASGVAHDFNNALQVILGGVELALSSKEPARVNKYLKLIKNSSMNAASRVKQLQRFAQKSQSAKESFPINVNKLAEDVMQEAKFLLNQFQEKGIHIAVKTSLQANKYIEGNVGELRVCLFNLIKNSAEAMPDGGLITISTQDFDGKVLMRVADTGTGMDKETQKKIFQPFFTTRGFEPGRGLGMSQVYSTIRDHNGEIYVKKNKIGHGTIMEISLPFSAQQVRLEKKEENYVGSARILWVDDEKMVRNMGKNMLEVLGHTADLAASGAEALEFLAKGKQYDLLITDIGMPKMSGWQLAEHIKNKNYKIKIAIVTGWGAEVTKEMKNKYKVSYVLVKPLPLKDLKALINEVLQTKKV